MKIIKPYHEILSITPNALELIELAYRNCYKSEDKIEPGSAEKLILNCMKLNHTSPLEHASATVRFVCDRGISHELVRHRLASYSQESTRYCRYTDDKFVNQITVIEPSFWDTYSDEYLEWLNACLHAEYRYMKLLSLGAKAEQARSVLPNSLKTEVVMTCNLREWKHVFRMRCQKAAHPQIREIMLPLLEELHEKIPVVFDEEFEMFFWTAAELDEAKAWAKKVVKNLNIELGGEPCKS